jgi:hypothetical protein
MSIKTRLRTLERAAERQTPRCGGTTVSPQMALQAMHDHPDAYAFVVLSQRCCLDNTPAAERQRIASVVKTWAGRVAGRLRDGQSAQRVRLEVERFPPEWFKPGHFARCVGIPPKQ